MPIETMGQLEQLIRTALGDPDEMVRIAAIGRLLDLVDELELEGAP
jgi:hypothetical protein